jgi:23S rRNA maturation mini-RNase III
MNRTITTCTLGYNSDSIRNSVHKRICKSIYPSQEKYDSHAYLFSFVSEHLSEKTQVKTIGTLTHHLYNFLVQTMLTTRENQLESQLEEIARIRSLEAFSLNERKTAEKKYQTAISNIESILNALSVSETPETIDQLFSAVYTLNQTLITTTKLFSSKEVPYASLPTGLQQGMAMKQSLINYEEQIEIAMLLENVDTICVTGNVTSHSNAITLDTFKWVLDKIKRYYPVLCWNTHFGVEFLVDHRDVCTELSKIKSQLRAIKLQLIDSEIAVNKLTIEQPFEKLHSWVDELKTLQQFPKERPLYTCF